MNTMINNPKRTVTINKPAEYVMNRLKVLGGWTGKNAGITISQANIDYNMNYYTFMCDGFISSIGNKGNAQVNPINNEQCSVTVEIGRTFGCIDDQYEASLCMGQIDAFFNILSALITKNDEEIIQFPTAEEMQNQDAGSNAMAVGILAFIIICMFIWFIL